MRKIPEVLALVLLASAAQAAIIPYTTSLSGPDEFPPNASPGTGIATIVYDSVLHTLSVEASFSGLIGTTTASHIHCCTPVPLTLTAGVATQTPSFIGFPLGVTAGSFSSVFDLTLAATWNAPFIAANGGTTAGAEAALAAGLDAGRAYYNIHSTFAPGGEIRGFFVPEPSTWTLLLGSLVGLAAIPIRKRR